jgi:hypothetical protein
LFDLRAPENLSFGRQQGAFSVAFAVKIFRIAKNIIEPAPHPGQTLRDVENLQRLAGEREFGGLAPATRRLLERVDANRCSRLLVARARKVAPGALLIREWRGAAHQVTVHDDGVVYRGKRYGSLSEIARLITGTRWSGPLFFGLRKRAEEARDGAA